jgi:6-phosphogluconolactonase
VLAIGSGGTLTEVPGSPFPLQPQLPGTTPSASALAVTPTVYPPAYALCSANVPPTTEHLYVTDSVNYEVVNYAVSSTGALSFVSQNVTGTVPSGVTVDPCNRFVYVSNGQPNNSVSAFTICSVISLPTCPNADFSLLPVSGSPFAAGNSPGPLMMDAYASFLYVVDTGQNGISSYRVSTTTGSLTPLSPTPITTNSFPVSIAIRSDDNWMFVANLNQATVSEYSITPATGALTPQSPIQTDNFPWGVAVK